MKSSPSQFDDFLEMSRSHEDDDNNNDDINGTLFFAAVADMEKECACECV